MSESRTHNVPRGRSARMTIISLMTGFTLLAAACAADDPIGAFDESLCELAPAASASRVVSDEHEEPVSDDGHDDEADDEHEEPVSDDGHDDEADDGHDDEADDGHDDEADDGHDDEAEAVSVDYVVQMDMLEFGYSCDLPRLELGTVLEFRMTNVGAVEHEAVFGDLAAQNEAEAQMAEASSDEGDDGHAGDHDTPTLVLASGESGTIVVSFEEAGDFIIGCHVAGHWDAGMRSDYVDYLWALEAPASATDVHQVVAPELAYTTVATVLTRLMEKGRLERARFGRSFVYLPLATEADHRASSMTDALGAAVDRGAVLSRFVDALAADDVEVLRRLLDEDA